MPFPESDPESLGRLRYAAAGLVRDIIVTRLREDPDFLSSSDRQRWGISGTEFGKEPCEFRLQAVKARLGRFLEKYIGYGDSISPPETDVDDPLIGLRIDLASFIDSEELNKAIGQARRGQPINWDALARWDLLPAIRAALDELPHPTLDRSGQGVSLYDAALFFDKDDRAATQMVGRWHDHKVIPVKPIGRCPTEGRRHLYRLPDVVNALEDALWLDSKEKAKLQQHLASRLRSPRAVKPA
jgi:hypothetical protein